jgi:NADPH-dependent 2,4-dienoyl-CoA reductase/sulfur reductase-like enzyme
VGEVVLEQLDTGHRDVVACDTVVMTGDWIPDNELARSGGMEIDPATKGPVVDNALRTSEPGLFAVGNLLHPVDTADIAALDGEHVATTVNEWLSGRGRTPDGAIESRDLPTGLSVHVSPPLKWVVPQRVDPTGEAPARHRLLTWCDAFVPAPVVEVTQDGALLGRHRIWWPAAPGRIFRLPASILSRARADGGDVSIALVGR